MWLNASLLLILATAAVQDFRSREVSNWLTIPLLAAGLAGLILHHEPLPILVFVLLTAAALRGWMGGADWKIQAGLLGLWPEAGLAALLASAAWAAAAGFCKGGWSFRFPAIPAYFLGAALTFFAQLWL